MSEANTAIKVWSAPGWLRWSGSAVLVWLVCSLLPPLSTKEAEENRLQRNVLKIA